LAGVEEASSVEGASMLADDIADRIAIACPGELDGIIRDMWVDHTHGRSTPAIFRFRAKLGTVWRDFDIDGSDTLENLAVAILDAFEFDCDHCYGFYSKVKGNKSKSDEVYELFADQEEGSPNENAKGVQETIIDEVFSPKKRCCFCLITAIIGSFF
jgi:hypothetical protein